MTQPTTARAEPVSAHLENALSSEIRRQGHVVWLDRDGQYSGFVDALADRSRAGRYPWPVVGFRGSFLETMFALEPYGSSLDKAPLLLHVPGHNKETIRHTPLLEAYESARVWERALPTLVREAASGRVAQPDIESFLGAGAITLESADTWLADRLAVQREGLDGQLAQLSALLLAEELLTESGRVSLKLAGDEAPKIVRTHLERLLGMDARWFEAFPKTAALPPGEAVKSDLWGWVLCVEYVSDLRREPHLGWLKPLRQLPAPLIEACRAIARDLRTRAPDHYERGANEVEELLAEDHASAADLGDIDTFRFEVAAIFDAAVIALKAGRWDECLAWASKRVASSFWLTRDQEHRWEWKLVEAAASLGLAIAKAPTPLKGSVGLAEAVAAYQREGAVVDRGHRLFEQSCVRLLEPRLPNFTLLKQVLGEVRAKYRAWADALAKAWSKLCGEVGYLPEASLQQRTLFEDVVLPLAQSGEKVAFFVIDALRFEMAVELAEELKSSGTQIDLKARLAELPTLTSVGMNALAPVANNGHLTPVIRDGKFCGFRTGDYTVTTPEHRARAMGQRAHGEPALKLDLARVADMETETLRRSVAQSRGLIVVHGTEIDDAGEAGFGVATFEQSLRQLKTAFSHLETVGVKQFVFTADHGFLLQKDEGRVREWGTRRDPSRRHVFTEDARVEPGLHAVSLAKLGYDGTTAHLVFHDETTAFATGVSGATFVHGGDSLQERVIPVLTVTRRRERGSAASAHVVEAEARPDLLGQRHLRFRVVPARDAQGALGFAAASEVDVALRIPDRPDIQVLLKETQGSGKLVGSRIRTTVGAEWTDIYFSLHGARDEKLRVELFHPDSAERVTPVLIEAFFAVSGTGVATPGAGFSAGWQELIVDAGARLVFEEVERHGLVTEARLVVLLGNPRAVRKFAAGFDTYLAYLPFEVRVESTASGKTYVKGGARE